MKKAKKMKFYKYLERMVDVRGNGDVLGNGIGVKNDYYQRFQLKLCCDRCVLIDTYQQHLSAIVGHVVF